MQQALVRFDASVDEPCSTLGKSAGLRDADMRKIHGIICGLELARCPAQTECPVGLLAQPLGSQHVVVARFRPASSPGAGASPATWLIHVLVIPAGMYQEYGADPFFLAENQPAIWDCSGDLPVLDLTFGPPPHRTVRQIRAILDTEPEKTQTLLGGVQALIDGGRLVFQRAAPEVSIIRDLWNLLPYPSRAEIWPCTFLPGDPRRYHIVSTPGPTSAGFDHYLTEEQMGDYPEGRYERALQEAAEQEDQVELNGLFARRGRTQTLRLAWMLLAVFVIIPPLVLHGGCPAARGGTQPGSAPAARHLP